MRRLYNRNVPGTAAEVDVVSANDVRTPSAVYPISCPECGAAVDAIVGAPAPGLRKNAALQWTDWTCPRCETRHQQRFGGPLLMVIPRHPDE